VPETIEQIPDSVIVARAHTAFRPERAVAAVNGPIDVQQAEQVFAEWFSQSRAPTPATTRTPGDSLRVAERNTVTAWLGLAFPVIGTAKEEAVRMIAFMLEDATRPGPDRPGLLGSSVEIERQGGHVALFVYLITEPDAVHAWLERVPELVRSYAAAPLPTDRFRQQLRRFRGIRLRQLATPDARARRNADALFFDTPLSAPERAIDALTPDVVQRTAATLGSPARGVVGPARVINGVPG
jgi:predicted Zn-dependent peptidase